MDEIAIRQLEVECVIGVYAHERDTPQPVKIDLSLGFDMSDAAQHEAIAETVDYRKLSEQVVFIMQSCRFRLVETAALTLAKWILAKPASGEGRALVKRVKVGIEKPNAVYARGVPRISLERGSADVVYALEEKPFGTVDIIHETKVFGLYRLNVEPGGEIPLHVHRVMREHELILTDGLLCQQQPIKAGTVFHWEHEEPHVYQNHTAKVQSILCVDSPPFIPGDEIEVR